MKYYASYYKKSPKAVQCICKECHDGGCTVIYSVAEFARIPYHVRNAEFTQWKTNSKDKSFKVRVMSQKEVFIYLL